MTQTELNLNQPTQELTPEEAMDLNSPWVKLQTNIKKTMKITNWSWGSKNFKNDKGEPELRGIFKCDVVLEDGRVVKKTFDTASNKLIEHFKKLYGVDKTTYYSVCITRKGMGKNTSYEVNQDVI